jgi:hypothetical protein
MNLGKIANWTTRLAEGVFVTGELICPYMLYLEGLTVSRLIVGHKITVHPGLKFTPGRYTGEKEFHETLVLPVHAESAHIAKRLFHVLELLAEQYLKVEQFFATNLFNKAIHGVANGARRKIAEIH